MIEFKHGRRTYRAYEMVAVEDKGEVLRSVERNLPAPRYEDGTPYVTRREALRRQGRAR